MVLLIIDVLALITVAGAVPVVALGEAGEDAQSWYRNDAISRLMDTLHEAFAKDLLSRVADRNPSQEQAVEVSPTVVPNFLEEEYLNHYRSHKELLDYIDNADERDPVTILDNGQRFYWSEIVRAAFVATRHHIDSLNDRLDATYVLDTQAQTDSEVQGVEESEGYGLDPVIKGMKWLAKLNSRILDILSRCLTAFGVFLLGMLLLLLSSVGTLFVIVAATAVVCQCLGIVEYDEEREKRTGEKRLKKENGQKNKTRRLAMINKSVQTDDFIDSEMCLEEYSQTTMPEEESEKVEFESKIEEEAWEIVGGESTAVSSNDCHLVGCITCAGLGMDAQSA